MELHVGLYIFLLGPIPSMISHRVVGRRGGLCLGGRYQGARWSPTSTASPSKSRRPREPSTWTRATITRRWTSTGDRGAFTRGQACRGYTPPSVINMNEDQGLGRRHTKSWGAATRLVSRGGPSTGKQPPRGTMMVESKV